MKTKEIIEWFNNKSKKEKNLYLVGFYIILFLLGYCGGWLAHIYLGIGS